MTLRGVPLDLAGTALSPATKRLLAGVFEAIAPDPVIVERFAKDQEGFRGSEGAGKRCRGYWKLWLPEQDGDYDYSIAHECGHCLVEQEQRTLRIDPDEPNGQYRQALALLLSYIEHVPAHAILAAEGFDVSAEVKLKAERYHEDVLRLANRPNGIPETHQWLALGLADIGRQVGSLDDAPMRGALDTLSRASPPTLELGLRLYAIVTPERQQDRDWRGMFNEIVQAGDVPAQLAAFVYDADEFDRRFGYY